MSNLVANVLKLFFGTKADKDAKEVAPYLEKIKAVYPSIEALSNDELRAKTEELKKSVKEAIAPMEAKIVELKATLESADISIKEKEAISTEIDKTIKEIDDKIEEVLWEILPVAFSIVKDTARRFTQSEEVVVTASEFDRNLATAKGYVKIENDTAKFATSWMAGGNTVRWDMVHYDSQLFGGVVLHSGKIAEMATGEGKTLVATLPIFLNALAGKGVHVVTVNDYLARRDSEWMGPIFEFHGLSIDCIDRHRPNSNERRKAYQSDITYGTNNEFGFDYLRDNMATSAEDLVQRKHHFAIVDEVDSVLVDDARTPLIISGPVAKGDDQLFDNYRDYIDNLYALQKNLVTQLLNDARKKINEGNTEEGGVLLYRAHKGLPKYKPLIKYLSEQGIKVLMQKTENTHMADNNRRMPEIVEPLYFVIDEKMHSVDLTDKGHEQLAKRTGDSKFFILPDIGTELVELEREPISSDEKLRRKDEVLNEFSLKSERVHTVNQLLKAYSLFEKDVEYVLIDGKIMIVDEQTGRIMDGRRYSDGLHQAIEAKEMVKVEAATQTFATVTLQNYFRMYHKLSGMTGTAETEASEFWSIYKLDVVVIPTNRPIQRNDRNDVIYKTKREKYAAVIEEIVKLVEAGRPILVGTTSVEISELLSRMLKLRNIPHNVLNAKQHQLEAQVVQEAGRKGQVTIATNMAGRGTDIKLTQEVKAAGGLAIIGTERHESRRVDRQLRGRSGRQGDPGSSVFFVSLEDDLMRLFGSERIASVMDRMGHKEGDALEAGMMNKAIERAQKKIEENNFGMRKRLLEYDDVMNSQREVIYRRRRHALWGERIEVDINNMVQDYATVFADQFGDEDFDVFKYELLKDLAVETSLTDTEYTEMSAKELSVRIADDILAQMKRKTKVISEIAMPVLKSIYEQNNASFENIAIPVTDGIKGFNVTVSLKKAVASGGDDIFKMFSKIVMLITIDDNWKEHLREMDDLKQSVQNASYEQKDPLLIYKFESFELFKKVLEKINRETLATLLRAFIPMREGSDSEVDQQKAREAAERARLQRQDMTKLHESRRDIAAHIGDAEKSKPEPVRVEKKVGRNEPCPCGSGKKYKNCHGASL